MKTTEKTKLKPKPKTREIYSWDEMRKYIEDKYECDIRDYDNAYKDGIRDKDKEYQDFWHVMIERLPIGNGAVLTVCWTDFLGDDWVRNCWILQR